MTIVSPDVIQSLGQLTTVWGRCVEDRGTGEVRDSKTLAIRWAENPFPFWNALANVEVGANREALDSAMGQAATYIQSKRQPGFLWVFNELLQTDARKGLPEAAKRAGLSLALSGHCMAGDILPLGQEPQHPELELRRVRTEAEVLACADINCQAYGFGAAAARAGFAGSRLWTGDAFAYLGLKDGAPVTTAITIAADGCLFVMMVATLPEHHHKGYGEAVTRQALFEGGRATGLRRATLHATEAGAPVYERIGMSRVGTLGFYAPQA